MGVFAHHGSGRNAIETFNGMIHRGLKPNAVTFVNLSKGCSHAGMVEDGLNYFNSMEKIYGVVPKEEHYSCAIDLLGRAGKLKEAEDFINNMPLAGVLFLRLVKFMGTWKGPDLQQTN